jgi:hypothetical protein
MESKPVELVRVTNAKVQRQVCEPFQSSYCTGDRFPMVYKTAKVKIVR